MLSSGFTLNLTVCAMFMKKPSDQVIEIPIDMSQQQRRKSLKSWSGYYFQNEEYCIDEDADKREFFWNIKNLVSIHECPVAFEDYKMPADYISTTDATTHNNMMKKFSIKDAVILNVEGLNNKAYESSTDNLESVQETHIDKLPTTNNDTNGVTNKKRIYQKSVSVISTKSLRPKLKKQTSIMDKKVRETLKVKYKTLYKDVYFILMLISFVMFHLGISVVYTHLLPFAESENTSSSVGLVMVSLLAGAGLIGKIALGAIAQSPWVNPIVLYVVAVLLCGKKQWSQSEK